MTSGESVLRFKDFLRNQGSIGAAILAKDWASTSLGPIDDWPTSLISTLRTILLTRQSIIIFWGADLLQFFNDAYAPTVDGMAPDPIGAPFKQYWAEVFEGVRPYYERAMSGEGTWEEDLHLRLTRDGVQEDTFWSFSYSPLYDDDGRIAGFMNIVHETSRGVRARLAVEATNKLMTLAVGRQSAIIELGDRLRAAQTIEEVCNIACELLGRALVPSRAGYAIIDEAAGQFEIRADWTRGVETMVGRHSLAGFSEIIDRLREGHTVAIDDFVEEDWVEGDAESLSEVQVRAQIAAPLLSDGELVGAMFVHSRERRRWTDDEIAFVKSVADRTYAAFVKVELEEQREILNRELSHRLKNTLAMVQAIAKQTLKTVPDKDVVSAFEQRIHTLSSAHDILLQANWSATDLHALVLAVLQNIAPIERFSVEGSKLKIASGTVLSVSLVLHELATNALKYGSLSVPDGKVEVAWSVAEGSEPGDDILTFTWCEVGGPAAEEPARKGFGSKLIGMGLAGAGGTVVRYLPSGLEVEMKAPLHQIRAVD